MLKTIVFVDGSKLSVKLLNILYKVNKFTIIRIIVSPNIDSKMLRNLKKKKFKKIEISDLKNKKTIKQLTNLNCDIIFSCYDYLIPKEILKKIKIGGINFHPSYLPFNRGRHSTFWAIMNKTPFGASSHWMDSKFDSGDIFFREKLKFQKFENAKQIYESQIFLLEKIMKKTINSIRKNIFQRKKQNKRIKDYHFAKDINAIVTKDYFDKISNIEFIDLIRATCFGPNTGIKVLYKKKFYLVNSKYRVSKSSLQRKYYIKLNEIFKDIKVGKNYFNNIRYKNYLFNIKSSIKLLNIN
jgi:methionyl-tRNA formyltransferase